MELNHTIVRECYIASLTSSGSKESLTISEMKVREEDKQKCAKPM